MKRVAVVLGLLAGLGLGCAQTAPLPSIYWYEMASCPAGAPSSRCTSAQTCSAGTCTGTAPSASTEGMELAGVESYRLNIYAASGQTLSGAGTMQAYVYNATVGLWSRTPALDQTVTASSTRSSGFADFKTGPRFGRVRFVANGVTVSSGSTLDVLLEAQPFER